jgi:hypothetical protein
MCRLDIYRKPVGRQKKEEKGVGYKLGTKQSIQCCCGSCRRRRMTEKEEDDIIMQEGLRDTDSKDAVKSL